MSSIAVEIPERARDRAAERIVQMGTGFMHTAALYGAAKLNIADLLADGPRPAAELAAATGSNEDALYRVLRALAAGGVFAETAPRTFALSPAAELLRSDVPGSMKNLVLWLGNRFHYHVWAELSYSLRTGKPAVEQVYGKPVFDCFRDMPEVAEDFNLAMTGLSAELAPAVVEAYDFSGIGTLMDIAGGHGRTLCEILGGYPRMKGIVFDLESVAEGAREVIRSRNLAHRCRTVAGNFFERIPPGADAYYMQHIIHDWDNEAALRILRNCRRALEGRSHGRLLVVDCIIPENGGQHLGKLVDLEMLLMPGGRERTLREFGALFSEAGFEIAGIAPTKAPESVIEARLV